MLNFLEMAAQAVEGTLAQLGEWWGAWLERGALTPGKWSAATWWWVGALLAALLLLWLLLRRGRRVNTLTPEFLISHGELALVDGLKRPPGAQVSAPGREKFALSLTLSNLEPWPVQLLELSVRTRGTQGARVVEAGAVVPPRGAVDVSAELFDLPGDSGTIDLYLYASRGARTYRVSAPLEWEPWGERYRIRALTATVLQARELPSEELARKQRRAYRKERAARRQRALLDETRRGAKALMTRVGEAAQKVTERDAGELEPGAQARRFREEPPARAQSSAQSSAQSGAPGGGQRTTPGGAPEGERSEAPARPRLEFPDEF